VVPICDALAVVVGSAVDESSDEEHPTIDTHATAQNPVRTPTFIPPLRIRSILTFLYLHSHR